MQKVGRPKYSPASINVHVLMIFIAFLLTNTFFEKLSRQFACKTDTTVGNYRWFG